VNSGLPAGTDRWIGQVLTDTAGARYAYVVGIYESEAAAQEGANNLIEAATTTPAYVIVENYLFFVDGEGSDNNIRQLLSKSPGLSQECVQNSVKF
jgi:hypothetical protein